MCNYKNSINYKFIVLSDIAGVADVAARRDDYIIPSSLLNSTISGLISRTVINTDPNTYHQAKYYKEYQELYDAYLINRGVSTRRSRVLTDERVVTNE
jgi:hypothetical protein